jgi:hypothetical protein
MRALPPPAPQVDVFVSFEVVSSVGALIRTFDDADAAIQWAETHQDDHPGCRPQRFKRVDRREPLWAPLQLVRRA